MLQNLTPSATREIVVDYSSPGRPPVAVTLGEEDYRKVLLVQTVIDIAPQILPRETVEKMELEEEDQPEHLVVPISEELLGHLPSAYRRLALNPIPWERLRFVIPLFALLVGVSTNALSFGLDILLGPERTIHVFVNPIVMLILWNVTVMGLLLIWHRRGDVARFQDSSPSDDSTSFQNSSPSSKPAPPSQCKKRDQAEVDLPIVAQFILRPVLRLWAMFIDPIADVSMKSADHARIAVIFLSRYYRVFRVQLAARAKTIMHLSAICLALGAIIGIYIQAVAWDYSFFWKSTLIQSPEYRLVVTKIFFWPAAIILGPNFPDIETLTAMAQGFGVPGPIWIHVFAVAAFVYIFLPRSWLVVRAASQTRGTAAAGAIMIDFISIREPEKPEPSGKYQPGDLFDRAKNEHFQQSVTLDYFALDADAMSVMSSLQAAMIELDIRNTEAGGLFGDRLTPKRNWYQEWRDLVQSGFTALPAEIRPALHPVDSNGFQSAIEKIALSPNPFASRLILLELAAFEAYWPFTSEEHGWAQKILNLGKITPSIAREIVDQSLKNASHLLGLPKGQGSLLRSELRNVNRSLSGYWKNIALIAGVGTVAGALTFGIAAPLIGGLIGHSMGLAGAAAVKAGLAAMGGGAIASGGMGIAGGTAVIFGGGALLGMGVGSSIAAKVNPAGVLIQAVKIEVFLRCIVVGNENAERIFQDVLHQLETSIMRMDDELKDARLNPRTESSRIAEREEVIKILGTCLKRCSDWAKERNILP